MIPFFLKKICLGYEKGYILSCNSISKYSPRRNKFIWLPKDIFRMFIGILFIINQTGIILSRRMKSGEIKLWDSLRIVYRRAAKTPKSQGRQVSAIQCRCRRREDSAGGSTCCSCRGPKSSASTPWVAHKLKLQLQEIWHPLLTSADIRTRTACAPAPM